MRTIIVTAVTSRLLAGVFMGYSFVGFLLGVPGTLPFVTTFLDLFSFFVVPCPTWHDPCVHVSEGDSPMRVKTNFASLSISRKTISSRGVLWMVLALGWAACREDETTELSIDPSIFSNVPCDDFVDVEEEIREMGRKMTCGFVEVPKQHDDAEGATLRIPVIVVESENPADATPVFYLEGGPGGAGLEILGDRESVEQLDLFFDAGGENRSWVFFNQRGTGDIDPQPDCLTNSDEAGDLETDLATGEDCYRSNRDAGFDAGDYNSVESAKDIDLIRRGLGLNRISLYGTSYGTLLAQHVVRVMPEGSIESIVLDGVVPMGRDLRRDLPTHMADVIRATFEACSEDAECAEAYPNLESEFDTLIDGFSEAPLTFDLSYRDISGAPVEETVALDTASFLYLVVGQGFVVPGYAEIFPAIVMGLRQIQDGGSVPDLMNELAQALAFYEQSEEEGFSRDMYTYTTCSEWGSFGQGDYRTEDVPTHLREASVLAARGEYELDALLCETWGQDRLPNDAVEVAQSDIPTLILNGSFDLQTPARYGSEVADNLSESYNAVFPTGHVVLGDGSCSNQITKDFFDNPNEAPSLECINNLAPNFDLDPNTASLFKRLQ